MTFWLIIGGISIFIINRFIRKKLLKLPISDDKLVLPNLYSRLSHGKYEFINYEYEYSKLYNKYYKALNLSEKERRLLNKVAWSRNKFSKIDFCAKETVKLYLLLLEKLDEIYEEKGITQVETFGLMAEFFTKKIYKYKQLDNRYDYLILYYINSIHQTIFRLCENAVREHYGHNRKLTITYDIPKKNLTELYEEEIISKVTHLLKNLVFTVAVPDNTTEIALNKQNKNRWKFRLKALQRDFDKDAAQFKAAIFLLQKQNEKHGVIVNLYYEAAKFIARFDSQTAMELYVYYVDAGLKIANFKPQLFSKAVNKRLFKTAAEEAVFDKIISDFKVHKNLKTALTSFEETYRKKIALDKDLIKIAHEKHLDTVNLLNEYLQEEEKEQTAEELKAETTKAETTKAEVPQEMLTANDNKPATILTEIQKELLNLFFENNFSIPISEVDGFALRKGLFKNQLIDEMNEACRELLGEEILIEEEEDCYTILEYDYHILSK